MFLRGHSASFLSFYGRLFPKLFPSRYHFRTTHQAAGVFCTGLSLRTFVSGFIQGRVLLRLLLKCFLQGRFSPFLSFLVLIFSRDFSLVDIPLGPCTKLPFRSFVLGHFLEAFCMKFAPKLHSIALGSVLGCLY